MQATEQINEKEFSEYKYIVIRAHLEVTKQTWKIWEDSESHYHKTYSRTLHQKTTKTLKQKPLLILCSIQDIAHISIPLHSKTF